MVPVSDFRDVYGYCNSCYLTAGMIIPAVTGQSWEGYITENSLSLWNGWKFCNQQWNMEDRKNMGRPYTTAYTDTLKEVPLTNGTI